MVNIEGLDKLELLRVLWERQEPCPEYRGRDIPVLTDEKASAALADEGGYVHFVCGKYIKIDFSKGDVDGALYDEYAGNGSLEMVVKNMRLRIRRNGFQSTLLDAVQQSLSVAVRLSRGYTPIRSDGACYWRCILESTREVLGISPSVNFTDGTGVDVIMAINRIRVDTASYVMHLREKEPDEWNHISVTAQLLLEERGELLEEWLARMRTPLEQLSGRDRWADELVFAVTPRMLRMLDVDVDVRVKQWVTTDQYGRVIREIDVALPASTSAVVINLRYYIHENGDGYHYDLLENDAGVVPIPVPSRPANVASDIPVANDTSDTESESDVFLSRNNKRGLKDPDSVVVAKRQRASYQSLPVLNKSLLEAAALGNDRDVDFLISAGADVDFSKGGALRAAVDAGHATVVSVLVKAGAVIPRDVLCDAAFNGHTAIVEILTGDDTKSITTNAKNSALRYAASAGKLDAAKVLVRAGAVANAGSARNSALHAAVGKGNVKMVEFLLDNGARNLGEGVVIQALVNKFFRIIDLLLEYDTFVSWERGRDISSGAIRLLFSAAERGHLALVTRMLAIMEKVKHPQVFDNEVHNAFCVAASNGHLSVVKILCETGLDIDSGAGQALRLAAKNGHTAVVNFILQQLALSVDLPENAFLFEMSGAVRQEDVVNAMREHVAVSYKKFVRLIINGEIRCSEKNVIGWGKRDSSKSRNGV